MSRRAFLARLAALGVSASAAGGILGACISANRPSASASPLASFGGTLPEVHPTPTTASYGGMIEASELVLTAPVSDPVRALLGEAAADARIGVAGARVEGRRQARLSVIADDRSLAAQAYQLDITPAADGPAIAIRAGSDAGVHYALRSLAELVVADGARGWIRAATIGDAPGFERRGAILDPWVLEAGGVTAASRAQLLDRVRLGVRHKLNFVTLPDRTPWPELARYCAGHHVELMVLKGYRDWLSATPRAQVKDALAAQLDAGARSISLDWDDIPTADPETLARTHAAVFRDLYGDLRRRDPGVRISTVLPPYGGIPGQGLVFSLPGNGERYLAVMRDALPGDVRVFWTGDSGIRSASVTRAGAEAYAGAIGHELGLWDNDAVAFARGRLPCSGRAPDLQAVVHTYMANLGLEARWEGTNGEFAMLTTLDYAWNPAAYSPTTAARAADQFLAGTPATG
jgi:hypothetical protein